MEIFMRDYFEPGLMARMLSCGADFLENDTCQSAFRQRSSVVSLNRLQPGVRIAAIRRSSASDEAEVDVETWPVDDRAQPNGKTHTDAFDLRLFRNGQLVGRWPSVTDDSDDIESWRQRHRITSPSGEPRATHTFVVRLPTGSSREPIRFSAYAFNEDRVKSATHEETLPWPSDVAPRRRRAYVVTAGVDAYAGDGRKNLEFAVKDARDMAKALANVVGYEVVSISLLAEQGGPSNATKDHMRAVLAVLAGDASGRASLTGVSHAEQLDRATPDDLVIFSFSGHGHTTPSGSFYMLPSDADPTAIVTPARLRGFISSEELSRWLEAVDAGQLAMIIDACHSAASVATPGFKPGPMGDRGLGQLAYDKGMRILAASQPDDVALEIRKLRQGLLTAALLEGFEDRGGRLRADSDADGSVSLTEWLGYGEARTPGLYQDAVDGKVKLVSRDSAPDPRFRALVAAQAQTPSLFDFNRQGLDPSLRTHQRP
jgi:hypothetical protein